MVRQWLRRQIEDEQPEASFERRWRGLVKQRVNLVFVLLAGWACVIEARLVYLQVYAHVYYQERAQHQQQNTIAVEAL